MAKYSTESLGWKIENEGFDYFFRHYANVESLPKWLQPAAKTYCEAAERLEQVLRDNGVQI